MCGITGFISTNSSFTKETLQRRITNMANTLRHRGPDGFGYLVDEPTQMALGHRRLSIQDLSNNGLQPMTSANARFTIVFNGEVYNFKKIRSELEIQGHKCKWRSSTDTEVILEAIAFWGLNKALSKFHGMFAFALIDNKEKTLTLVRDRFGEKPLYYGFVDSSLVFGSELKSICCWPEFHPEIDIDSLGYYFKLSYIPSPRSIYKNVFKVDAGEYIVFNIPDILSYSKKIYWSASEVSQNTSIFTGDIHNAKTELKKILTDIISNQMISDVPLGAFFSGGIDSSVVSAIMQSNSIKKIKTFSIGFIDKNFDESKHAEKIANYLGTEHTTLIATEKEAYNIIPKLTNIYDEPFSDSSQIPTYIVSKLTKQHVTVSLSGDGGDELFAGYNRHISGPSIWRNIENTPLVLRKLLTNYVKKVSTSKLDIIFQIFKHILPSKFDVRNPGQKIHKLAHVSCAESFDQFYDILRSNFINLYEIGSFENTSKIDLHDARDMVLSMQVTDIESYLKDDIMVKVDRASMANSLESRAPLLDHKLAQFAFSLPLFMRTNQGVGKILLRNVLSDYIPPDLVQRPKTGFSIPLADWLRGHLKDWCMDMINYNTYNKSLHLKKLYDFVNDFLNYKHEDVHSAWCILMFYAWTQNNKIYI